jgi:hypothetical protein
MVHVRKSGQKKAKKHPHTSSPKVRVQRRRDNSSPDTGIQKKMDKHQTRVGKFISRANPIIIDSEGNRVGRFAT